MSARRYDTIFDRARTCLDWADRTPISAHVLRHGRVLDVGEVFAPYGVALGEGEVCHEVVGGGAVPVFFARGDADDVTGTDTNERPTARLYESVAFGDEQRLPERVVMPRRV